MINRLTFFPQKSFDVPQESLPQNVRHFFITTQDRKKIECYLVERNDSSKIVIYFHGNAGNISQRLVSLIKLSNSGASILGVGYRGYGSSTGRPTEKGIYRDGEAAFKYVIKELGYSVQNVFLFGRSIGTAVAIHTGRSRKLGGIILITPLTNARDCAKAYGLGLFSFLAGNRFDNLTKCRQIIAPVLIVHGTDDELIPFYMGTQIFDHINSDKRMVTINQGRHNDLEFKEPEKYWDAIISFVAEHSVAKTSNR